MPLNPSALPLSALPLSALPLSALPLSALPLSALPRLQAGDKVALVAPASGQKPEQQCLIKQAITQLEAWGLDVVLTPAKQANAGYLSADDKTRAADLRHALTHPDIKAVLVTRGGYGCARLLTLLNGITVPSPRYLVGFSDITTLHLYFANLANVFCLHAPNVATGQFLADTPQAENNRQALKQVLFNKRFPVLNLHPVHLPANADSWQNANTWQKAPVTGGCLSLLVTSLGTPHSLTTAGKTLFIEEIGEPPYKIDRLLTHLKNAGQFEHVKAVIFGELVKCDSRTVAVQTLLRDFFVEADFPVLQTAQFGHGAVNMPWSYGCPAVVKVL